MPQGSGCQRSHGQRPQRLKEAMPLEPGSVTLAREFGTGSMIKMTQLSPQTQEFGSMTPMTQESGAVTLAREFGTWE